MERIYMDNAATTAVAPEALSAMLPCFAQFYGNASSIHATGREARKKLEEAGFFMRSSGVSVYYANTTTAESQSIPAGESAAIGTVVVKLPIVLGTACFNAIVVQALVIPLRKVLKR